MNFYEVTKCLQTKKLYFVLKPRGYGKKAATKKRKKGMAIYRNGKKLTARQLRSVIMQANNWTEEQYRKQYDIFKNKLRFYESVQASRGVKDYLEGGSRSKQSPQELLYKIARAKLRFGEDYEPSQEIKQIESVTAHSITKGARIAKAASSKAYKSAVSKIVNIRFSGFTEFYTKAQEILERISDPVKQEAALVAFAEYLHATYPRSGKDKGAPKKGEGGIAYGETFGSDDKDLGGEFDIEEWLE